MSAVFDLEMQAKSEYGTYLSLYGKKAKYLLRDIPKMINTFKHDKEYSSLEKYVDIANTNKLIGELGEKKENDCLYTKYEFDRDIHMTYWDLIEYLSENYTHWKRIETGTQMVF